MFFALSNSAQTRFTDASTTAARRQARDAAYTRMWVADGLFVAGAGLAALQKPPGRD